MTSTSSVTLSSLTKHSMGQLIKKRGSDIFRNAPVMFRDPTVDGDYSSNHMANSTTFPNDKEEMKNSSHENNEEKKNADDVKDLIEFSSLPLNLSCKKQSSDFTKTETGNTLITILVTFELKYLCIMYYPI